MSLTGFQINPIDVNFHLQKSLESFDKKSAEKMWSKKDKKIKVSPLMPIRVKISHYKEQYFIKEDQNNFGGKLPFLHF